MDERSSAAWMAGFLAAVILLLAAADLFTEDRLFSVAERRILAGRPELTWETVMDGSYMEDCEKYLTDQFVGRDTWMKLKEYADIIFRKRE